MSKRLQSLVGVVGIVLAIWLVSAAFTGTQNQPEPQVGLFIIGMYAYFPETSTVYVYEIDSLGQPPTGCAAYTINLANPSQLPTVGACD